MMTCSQQIDMFPVRVVVESVNAQRCLSCAHDGSQLLDTFAIVSGQTPLGQLVNTVLSALGFPQLIHDSRGLIQINNWKPLPFETITDNKEEPVANLFKEISSNIILKILTKHNSTDPHNSSECITNIKQRLLKVAMEKQPHLLTSMNNREIKETIQQLISGENEMAYNLSNEAIMAINEWLDQISNEPTNYNNTIQATRCFNVIEIAKLERWFLGDQNPQRPKLLGYMQTLNNSPYRKSGSKVTYQQICNWFTNQRAVLRKQHQIAQNLQQNIGPGLTAMSVNEFQQLRNTFQPNISDMQINEPSSSIGINMSTSSLLNTSNFGLMNSSGSPTTTASATVSAASSTAGTTDIPIATTPIDIASKFGSSNGCNTLLDQQEHHNHQSDGERIDGGSESPNGNDDASARSDSEPNGFEIHFKESGTSSPAETTPDVNAMSPSNTMRHHTPNVSDLFNSLPTSASGQETITQAAAAAAAMFGLASGENSIPSAQDFARQNGALAAFSSLMPLLGSSSPFGATAFLNSNGSMSSAPPQSGSPISSNASSTTPIHNPLSNFGGNLKMSSIFKDENSIKMEMQSNNNNNSANNNNNNAARSRLMFDPLSELPVLERWFEENPHPNSMQIEQYTDILNSCMYRQNYPPISTHNVKIWFKNRRAKCKRLNLVESTPKQTALSA